MTEEIIIDGVDVANCGYFCETDKECSICGMGTDGEDTFCRYCEDNSNCYYKQLKHLEFELKVTKADYEASEQENRELKAYKDINEDFKKAWDELNEKYKQLRSALEEIREIIDGHASPPECDYYGSYKNACEPCALRILKQTEGKIIDKINEVLK